MEIGESLWKFEKYRAVKRAPQVLSQRGEVLIHNFDRVIKNDPDVRIIKQKRKLNGKIYFYVLEKL